MKEIRDYINKISDDELLPLAEEVAMKLYDLTDKTDEDALTVTTKLVKEEFKDMVEMKLSMLYLDGCGLIDCSEYGEE